MRPQTSATERVSTPREFFFNPIDRYAARESRRVWARRGVEWRRAVARETSFVTRGRTSDAVVVVVDVDGWRRVARAGVIGVDGDGGTVRPVVGRRRGVVGERGERVDAGRCATGWAKDGFGAADGRRRARRERFERWPRAHETRSGSKWCARRGCGRFVARVFFFGVDDDVEDFGRSVGVDVSRARWGTARWTTTRGFSPQL